jgi:hypothetical protein
MFRNVKLNSSFCVNELFGYLYSEIPFKEFKRRDVDRLAVDILAPKCRRQPKVETSKSDTQGKTSLDKLSYFR